MYVNKACSKRNQEVIGFALKREPCRHILFHHHFFQASRSVTAARWWQKRTGLVLFCVSIGKFFSTISPPFSPLFPGECVAVDIPYEDTVGLIRERHPADPTGGPCTNKAPVRGLRQCSGQCTRGAAFWPGGESFPSVIVKTAP